MRPRLSVRFLTASLIAFFGCRNEDSHPPFLAIVCDQKCVLGNQQSGPPKTDAGERDAADDGSVAFHGSVFSFTETSFNPTHAALYNGPGDVTLFGTPSVTGSFVDGVYTISAGPSGVVWALARPFTGSDGGTPSNRTLPTFQYVNAAFPDLYVVPTNLLTEIYAGLTVPTIVDTSRAQILLLFRQANDALASGVAVTPPPGSTAAYDTGSGYSDVQTATGPSGMVLLVNVDAVPLPGADLPITFTRGAKAGSVSARAAQGTATLLLVTVPS